MHIAPCWCTVHDIDFETDTQGHKKSKRIVSLKHNKTSWKPTIASYLDERSSVINCCLFFCFYLYCPFIIFGGWDELIKMTIESLSFFSIIVTVSFSFVSMVRDTFLTTNHKHSTIQLHDLKKWRRIVLKKWHWYWHYIQYYWAAVRLSSFDVFDL